MTIIVLSNYISVKACRCQYVNRICLAHLYMYNYTTFIFFMLHFCFCFKYDAYVNLKLFEYKEKRIMRRSKGCTCISLVRHSDYSLPGTLIRHCSCCGYFVRSKKKNNHSLDKYLMTWQSFTRMIFISLSEFLLRKKTRDRLLGAFLWQRILSNGK